MDQRAKAPTRRFRRSYTNGLYPAPNLFLFESTNMNARRPHRLADVDWSSQHLMYFARDRFVRKFQCPLPRGTFRCLLCSTNLTQDDLFACPPPHLTRCLPNHPAAARAALLYAKQLGASLKLQQNGRESNAADEDDDDEEDEEEEFANVSQTRTDQFSVMQYLCCKNRRFSSSRRRSQVKTNRSAAAAGNATFGSGDNKGSRARGLLFQRESVGAAGSSQAHRSTDSRFNASFSIGALSSNSGAATNSWQSQRRSRGRTRSEPREVQRQQRADALLLPQPRRRRGRRSTFENYAQLVLNNDGRIGRMYRCNACGTLTSRNVKSLSAHLSLCYPKEEIEQLVAENEARVQRERSHYRLPQVVFHLHYTPLKHREECL